VATTPFDVFLKLPPQAGTVTLPVSSETQRADLPRDVGQWIELKSYHFGIENSATQGSLSGGAGTGRATFSDLIVTKQVDQLSPTLLQVCGLGAHFDQIELALRRSGATASKTGTPFLTYSFKLASVKTISWATSNVDDVLEEHITFSFAAMQVSYKPMDATGKLGQPVVGAWSQTKNAAQFAV
jgi:type VI secretion system secreted protein Hcp